MSTIEERIRNALTRYMVITGIEPTRMYLGRLEDRDLEDEWRQYRQYAAVKGPACVYESPGRRQFMDMEIYVVDADSHLGFGGGKYET
jgi:hypothetical protein